MLLLGSMGAEIESHVGKVGDCLVWIGGMDAKGPTWTYNGKNIRPRRVFWMKKYGEIGIHDNVLNVCGNRKCISPYHCKIVKKETHTGPKREPIPMALRNLRHPCSDPSVARQRERYRKNYFKRVERPGYRLAARMRILIWWSIRRNKGGRSWESLVGYSREKLKAHLEKRFKPGMGWHNMGEWHIDHKRPVDSFRFEKPEDPEFKECWALKNLQPMWAVENLRKGNRLHSLTR